MKKLIALSLMALALTACTANKSETYTREMTVTEINTTEDIVVLVCTEGHEWAFYGVENWLVGDNCTCTMDSKGTKDITDDEIIFTTYKGNECSVVGVFTDSFENTEGKTYYHFKSNDNESGGVLLQAK